MSEIKALPLNGFAPDNKVIADHLREQAQWIEDGDPVRNCYVITEFADGTTSRNSCGQPTDLARTTGVMLMSLMQETLFR